MQKELKYYIDYQEKQKREHIKKIRVLAKDGDPKAQVELVEIDNTLTTEEKEELLNSAAEKGYLNA